MEFLKINNLTKSYKGKKAVEGISFNVYNEEIVRLLGKIAQ